MRRRDARWAVGLLLAAWAAGLAVATTRLQVWQAELVPVLAQLQADTLVRTAAPGQGHALSPHWYQRRALALLSAVERLHDDSAWTLVMPGSWRAVDDVEERAAARVERAFRLVVVQTIRRALEQRASALTGVALRVDDAALDLGTSCRAPPLTPAAAVAHPASLAVADMPEFAALVRFLDEAQRLEGALTVLRDLRQDAPARAEDVAQLVGYSLGASLPGPTRRSLALFQAAARDQEFAFDALRERLRGAMACTALRGARALHERLETHNPLLVKQQRLIELVQAGLFETNPDERQAPRAQRALEVLDETEVLLEAAAHPWMHEAHDSFGSAHHDLLDRIAAISLLGPQVARQATQEARMHHARLLKRWRAGRDRPEVSLAWDAARERFVSTPRRAALHLALDALLRETASLNDVRAGSDAVSTLGALEALMDRRQRLWREVVPMFPASMRAAAGAWVDRRIEDRVASQARQLVARADPETAQAQLRQMQSMLAAAQAPALADSIGRWLQDAALSAPEAAPTPHSDGADAGEAPASAAD